MAQRHDMIIANLYVGSRYPVDRQKLRAAAVSILEKNHVTQAQLDVSIVGQRKMTTLNKLSFKKAKPTDVLSFPQHEKKRLDDFPLPAEIVPHLGDVVISYPEAVRMARRFGKLVDDQLIVYLEHGIMHLLGYHHE